MKQRPLSFLKSALITGVLIVLPAWLAVLLLLKVLLKIGVVVRPIANQMPDEVNHPEIISLLVFCLSCLVVGILVHTGIGKVIGAALDRNLFNRVPGYQSLRGIARQFRDMEATDGFKPALIEVEDGSLAPAFLIETHASGFSTVFVPSVPTPMAGSILIMPAGRVRPIDVPVTTMMKCISKWGLAEVSRAAFNPRMNPTKKRILSVSVVQAGLVLGGLYGLISVIISVFLLLFGLIAALVGAGAGDATAAVGGAVGMIVIAVIIPFIYGAMGFVCGIIVAAVYNLIAKMTGGIEVTVVETF
eukprot:g4067.t1